MIGQIGFWLVVWCNVVGFWLFFYALRPCIFNAAVLYRIYSTFAYRIRGGHPTLSHPPLTFYCTHQANGLPITTLAIPANRLF